MTTTSYLRCDACYGTEAGTTRSHLGNFVVDLCDNVRACRERAIAAGIYLNPAPRPRKERVA